MAELRHHGILGQKWGVRRYQNPDGTWTAAGKRRYAKDLSKMSDRGMVKESIKKTISDSNEIDKNSLIKVDKNFRKALDDHASFENSSEAREASDKAYQQTIQWYKKHDPDYLNEIISENGGSEERLAAFHDFRKTFEGYESEALHRAEKKYNATHFKTDINAAAHAYVVESKKVVNTILDKYGNTKMKNLPKNRFHEYEDLNNVVRDAIDDWLNEQSR